MQFLNIYFLVLCGLMLVSWINATPYNYYQSSNVGRFGGNSFGEGVLRPGSDTGEGIFNEYDAPSYSPPSYSAPTYAAPTYSAPTYSAPSYSAPTYNRYNYQ